MADAGAAIERARTKTEEMQARAGAMDELIASGTLEDFTSDQTQLDRELAQMASQSQVESELAKLKQEVGHRRRAKAARAGGADGPPIRAGRGEGRERSRSIADRLDRRVVQREPLRQVLLDRQLLLELRLQLELLRVVALLAVAHRDERPERLAS